MASSAPLTAVDKVRVAEGLKEEGNRHFKEGDTRRALSNYSKIFAYINGLHGDKSSMRQYLKSSDVLSEDDESKIQSLKLSAHLNMAACHIKLQQYTKVIDHCTKALDISPVVKAFFRRGQAYLALGDLDNAERDLNQAASLDPNDGAILTEKKKLQSKLAEHERKERKQFAGMFDRM
eukprot:GILK01005067.1.p1 GENE.GILK01005067.1~~GILK01005067.1.p1  ORF type:complete len:196 (+),score=26.75 GILK01005067.1:57-590(+)